MKIDLNANEIALLMSWSLSNYAASYEQAEMSNAKRLYEKLHSYRFYAEKEELQAIKQHALIPGNN